MIDLAIARRRIFAGFRILTVCFLCIIVLTKTDRSNATCAACACIAAAHLATQIHVSLEHGVGVPATDPESLAYDTANVCVPGIGTRGWVSYQMCLHREQFFVFYWFKENVLAALMMMTEQLVAQAMNQMFIIGTFFDAEMQLETQRLFQQLAAQAHKDYHPSFEMCEIGTIARSLASSYRLGEVNGYALSKHLQNRQMRNYSMSTSAGKGNDVNNRWTQFVADFCNHNDNDAELGPRGPASNLVCQAAVPVAQRNADIDYGRSIDQPLTIDVSYTNPAAQPDDEVILSMAANLYGHDAFAYFPEALLNNRDNRDDYMHLRSVVAKRSVAQNSFNAIVGLKTWSAEIQATQDLRVYMGEVLHQLGIADPGGNYIDILGERPSYYAQMEFLSKRLYQRPEFYTALYDKPVNIERKKAAMRAIGLMQNMDLFKSKLRTEAALAVLTELEIAKEQEDVQNRMNLVRTTGEQ